MRSIFGSELISSSSGDCGFCPPKSYCITSDVEFRGFFPHKTDEDSFFKCVCNEGYVGNGWHCEDIDECVENWPCPLKESGGFCVDTDPTDSQYPRFKCGCQKGFEASSSDEHGATECTTIEPKVLKTADLYLNVKGASIFAVLAEVALFELSMMQAYREEDTNECLCRNLLNVRLNGVFDDYGFLDATENVTTSESIMRQQSDLFNTTNSTGSGVCQFDLSLYFSFVFECFLCPETFFSSNDASRRLMRGRKFNYFNYEGLPLENFVNTVAGKLESNGVKSICVDSIAATTTTPSRAPSDTPSASPSLNPSSVPTNTPSTSPTSSPSTPPSNPPTIRPTAKPTQNPTSSARPSSIPSFSLSPSSNPSDAPSLSASPSSNPSRLPSISQRPSESPSTIPSFSQSPSLNPSNPPSVSASPSSNPSAIPSISQRPSNIPSNIPSSSQSPSNDPSNSPSLSTSPSMHPSTTPSDSSAPSISTCVLDGEVETPKSEQLIDPPCVTTRGHFDSSGNLNPGFEETTYTTEGDIIPGITGVDCPSEIVIYIHGFANDANDAKENFRTAHLSLVQLGYDYPFIGYTWDSDVGWFDSQDTAIANGKKLAQFLFDYKIGCPTTKIRIITHSLGTRVALEALKSLHQDQHLTSWTTNGWKVRSLTTLGAAVNNEEVQMDNNGYGSYIQNEVDQFDNKYSTEDDILRLYPVTKFSSALGKTGAEDGIDLPSNYNEEMANSELIKDVGGDGYPNGSDQNIGDNHSGYNGIIRGNILVDNGCMNRVVDDWIQQEGGEEYNTCAVKVTLESIAYQGDDIGNDWDWSSSVGGESLYVVCTALTHDTVHTINTVIMDRKVANEGEQISLDVRINAIENDVANDDEGGVDAVMKICCNSSIGPRSHTVTATAVEGSNTASLLFSYSVETTALPTANNNANTATER